MLVAIDPGYEQSGWVCMDVDRVTKAMVLRNEFVLAWLARLDPRCEVVIESVSSFGMPVGREVFETVHWAGRFYQAAERFDRVPVGRLFRKDVKLHLCGSLRAKDKNVWLAVLDKYGGKTAAVGNVKKPGPLHSVRSHCRAAVAVAIAWQEGCRSQIAEPAQT